MEKNFSGYLFFVMPDFRSISSKFDHESYNAVSLIHSDQNVIIDLDWKNNGRVKPLKVVAKIIKENTYQGKVYDQGEDIEEDVFFTTFFNGPRLMISGEWIDGKGQWSMVGEFHQN